ncbi:MAG: 3-hydroxybutyrate oligomer hydrolase family protein [Desulfococcaceae bacterium]
MTLKKPDFIKSQIHAAQYDGITDDLLTGGFGKTGLSIAQEPCFADPENPTAAELRSWAIYYDYRGLMDVSPDGGYGLLYGPGVNPDGSLRSDEGKIAGKEYLTFSDDGSGKQNLTLMVQIPEGFDPHNPRIIASASSGSRGIYGAVGVVGEWGLKRGFAVAYTDKGTGIGVHDLHSDTVNTFTGQRADADSAGNQANFKADDKNLAEFRKKYPFRIAYRHAHSRQNPEKDWGQYVLQAIEFAFYVLNLPENYGKISENGQTEDSIRTDNTLVMAAGISNGAGSVLRALEQDSKGLIQGAVASEPNICPAEKKELIIRQEDREWAWPQHSRNLLDYNTLLNLYQPCANLAAGIRDRAPFHLLDESLCMNRCQSLAKLGLLKSADIASQAAEAQKIINNSGILEEQNLIAPVHYGFSVSESIAITYANTYGRFGVEDSLCGFGFAGIGEDLKPASLSRSQLSVLFSKAAGIPPMPPVYLTKKQWKKLSRLIPKLKRPMLPIGQIDIICNESAHGPAISRYSVSQSGMADMNLDGALHLRRLATGKDESGNPLKAKEAEYYQRIQEGIEQVRASGNLRGKPVIIFHGRSDAILPPNHTSRAYFGLNRMTEGQNSKLRYYEITNCHHMDAFNALPGFRSRFVPIHCYMIQSLNLMFDHLTKGTVLPPDQVVRTIPRVLHKEKGIKAFLVRMLKKIFFPRLYKFVYSREEGKVPVITRLNVPLISSSPSENDKIIFRENTVHIPG